MKRKAPLAWGGSNGHGRNEFLAGNNSGIENVCTTLNIPFKRLDPEFQYWISLIFPKNSVLMAPRGLLFF